MKNSLKKIGITACACALLATSTTGFANTTKQAVSTTEAITANLNNQNNLIETYSTTKKYAKFSLAKNKTKSFLRFNPFIPSTVTLTFTPSKSATITVGTLDENGDYEMPKSVDIKANKKNSISIDILPDLYNKVFIENTSGSKITFTDVSLTY